MAETYCGSVTPCTNTGLWEKAPKRKYRTDWKVKDELMRQRRNKGPELQDPLLHS